MTGRVRLDRTSLDFTRRRCAGQYAEALNILDEILVEGQPYDVIISGVSQQTVFGGSLEDVLLGLDNGGATEVLEIDVPQSLLDDAATVLTP